jgi:uncharacterized membrane protein YidH (DUF202 family)
MTYNPVGFIFLAYGVIKIILVLGLMLIPPQIEKKLAAIEGFDMFVSGDDTIAGKMYEYVLLAFAIFSIIHGLALLGVFNQTIHNIIEKKAFQYPLYIALGLWLMIFYLIVIYTNVPISKDTENPKHMTNYKIYCWFGGLSFLLVPVVWEIIEYFNPSVEGMRQDKQLMYMTLLMLGAIFIIFLVYIVVKRLYSLYQTKKLNNKNNTNNTNNTNRLI